MEKSVPFLFGKLIASAEDSRLGRSVWQEIEACSATDQWMLFKDLLGNAHGFEWEHPRLAAAGQCVYEFLRGQGMSFQDTYKSIDLWSLQRADGPDENALVLEMIPSVFQLIELIRLEANEGPEPIPSRATPMTITYFALRAESAWVTASYFKALPLTLWVMRRLCKIPAQSIVTAYPWQVSNFPHILKWLNVIGILQDMALSEGAIKGICVSLSGVTYKMTLEGRHDRISFEYFTKRLADYMPMVMIVSRIRAGDRLQLEQPLGAGIDEIKSLSVQDLGLFLKKAAKEAYRGHLRGIIGQLVPLEVVDSVMGKKTGDDSDLWVW